MFVLQFMRNEFDYPFVNWHLKKINTGKLDVSTLTLTNICHRRKSDVSMLNLTKIQQRGS